MHLLLATGLALAASTVAPPPALHSTVDDEHGAIDWFEGSFDELITKATAEKRIVFLDFWTDWCGYCKKLDKETFSDARVAAAMEDILCYSIDAESESGAPLAARFAVEGFPALILLNPDGTARDIIGGYLPPDAFLEEIARVVRDDGTVNAFRRKVDAAPEDIGARFALIQRLAPFGAQDEIALQHAEILRLDPEGKNPATRRMRLDEAIRAATAFDEGELPDPAPIVAFVAGEDDPTLLLDAHGVLAAIYDYLAEQDAPEKRGAHAKNALGAYRMVWKHLPEEMIVPVGTTLAGRYWIARETIDDETKAFALELATKAVELAPSDATAVDALACALFMNGRADEARAQNARCIELAPANPEWAQRKATFDASSDDGQRSS